jgi:hypothetical protein
LMKAYTGSGTMQPTSLGMRSECLAHVATRNCNRFEATVDASVVLKMSVEEPKTSCVVEMDHMCLGRVSIMMNTLNLSGEKRASARRV